MSDIKCKHEWEYWNEKDYPNGYEYDEWSIPHKRCKKCGREYELFDGYGEYAKRWRKVEPWLPELHKLEQKLIRMRKALDIAVDALKDNLSQANFREMLDVSRFHCIRTKCEFALTEITELEQKDEK